MMIESYQQQESVFGRMAQTLAMLYKAKSVINRSTLTSINNIHNSIKNDLLLQQYLFSRVEVQKALFDLNIEIQNTIELSYMPASDRGISITYTRDQGLPACVSGYKSLHSQILHTLLGYVVKKSEENSTISILVEVSTAVHKEMTISYKFTFRSNNLKDQELDFLFQVRKNSLQRRLFTDLLSVVREYGNGMAVFDAILYILKGCVTETTISDIDPGKVVIAFRLPFTATDKDIQNKIFRLNTNSSITETPLTVK